MIVKRIMRYLKGIDEFGLYYKRNKKIELRTYNDADWGGNIDERKSTSGGALFLGRRLVTWTSKKQSCTSQSTTKAEYVILYCDNTSSINISRNPVMHAKTKHIAIKYHYVREIVEEKEVKMVLDTIF